MEPGNIIYIRGRRCQHSLGANDLTLPPSFPCVATTTVMQFWTNAHGIQSWITHLSVCTTMQGRIQQELWLICWIAGAGKCFMTPLFSRFNLCDYDLIPKIKEPLCGTHFHTVCEVLQITDCSLHNIQRLDNANSIHWLPHIAGNVWFTKVVVTSKTSKT